jgi:hypothetical protein
MKCYAASSSVTCDDCDPGLCINACWQPSDWESILTYLELGVTVEPVEEETRRL